jgi:hypothetical protein
VTLEPDAPIFLRFAVCLFYSKKILTSLTGEYSTPTLKLVAECRYLLVDFSSNVTGRGAPAGEAKSKSTSKVSVPQRYDDGDNGHLPKSMEDANQYRAWLLLKICQSIFEGTDG